MYVLYHFKKIFLDKALTWHYKEHHHDKGQIKSVQTIRKVMFRKVKHGHVILNCPSESSDTVKQIIPRLSTVYMLASRKFHSLKSKAHLQCEGIWKYTTFWLSIRRQTFLCTEIFCRFAKILLWSYRHC